MAEKKSDQNEEDPLGFELPGDSAVLRQEVELRNGVRMPHSTARAYWEILQDMLRRAPDQFDALVAVVIHKRDPADLSPSAVRRLRDRSLLHDGAAAVVLAAVLEASYQEPTADRPPLRYPMLHPDRAQVEELNRTRDQRMARVLERFFGDDKGEEGRSR